MLDKLHCILHINRTNRENQKGRKKRNNTVNWQADLGLIIDSVHAAGKGSTANIYYRKKKCQTKSTSFMLDGFDNLKKKNKTCNLLRILTFLVHQPPDKTLPQASKRSRQVASSPHPVKSPRRCKRSQKYI
jgi:hypothetical protein